MLKSLINSLVHSRVTHDDLVAELIAGRSEKNKELLIRSGSNHVHHTAYKLEQTRWGRGITFPNRFVEFCLVEPDSSLTFGQKRYRIYR